MWHLFAANQATTVVAVPAGDSLTRGALGYAGGYRRPLADLYLGAGYALDGSQEEPAGYFHEGRNGETLVQMEANWAARWAAKNGNIVLIEGGWNDILAGANAATCLARLDALLTTIESTAPLPSRILVTGISPSSNAVRNATAQAYNAGIAAQLAGHPRAEYVDWNATIDSTTASPVIDGTDPNGLHPREFAYADLAHVFAEKVIGAAPTAAVDAPTGGATLVRWFRADDVVESGGKVTQFNERQGSGDHAVQADPAKQLVRSIGSLGQACVTGNGTGWYRTGAFALAQPATLVVVAKITATPSMLADGIALANRNAMYLQNAGVHGVNESLNIYAGSDVTYSAVHLNVGKIYVGQFNGAASLARFTQVVRSYGNVGAQTLDGLTLCASAGTPPAAYIANGEFYEWALYSGYPTNMRAIEQGLRSRYEL